MDSQKPLFMNATGTIIITLIGIMVISTIFYDEYRVTGIQSAGELASKEAAHLPTTHGEACVKRVE